MSLAYVESNVVHGEYYEWVSSSPILANNGIWKLCVLPDQPPKESFRYVGAVTIGAADGPQFLQPKWR